jgi:hypothetical protein
MKRTIKVSLGLLILIFSLTTATEASLAIDTEAMNVIRKGFYVAIANEDTTISLMKFIKEQFSSDYKKYPPVILAYYAALEGLQGRHASNPFSKFVHVSRAVEKMNLAVEKDPDLIEGRFLRFSFFHQIPGIFGMGDKVPEDLQKTIVMLEKRDYSFVGRQLQEDMIEYRLRTDQLDAEKRTRLEQLAVELHTEQ